MCSSKQPKNMKLVSDKFLCPKRVLSNGKLSLRMYNLISNPYLQYRDKDVNDMCFDASSHPSKTYFSQVVDEVKDLAEKINNYTIILIKHISLLMISLIYLDNL